MVGSATLRGRGFLDVEGLTDRRFRARAAFQNLSHLSIERNNKPLPRDIRLHVIFLCRSHIHETIITAIFESAQCPIIFAIGAVLTMCGLGRMVDLHCLSPDSL